MAKSEQYLTPWLQEILAEFKSHPSEKTFHDIMNSPLPERIKSALCDAHKRWSSRLTIIVPNLQDRERERNIAD